MVKPWVNLLITSAGVLPVIQCQQTQETSPASDQTKLKDDRQLQWTFEAIEASVEKADVASSTSGCEYADPTLKDGEERVDGSCYQPVCRQGYYKCCATCQISACISPTKMPLWNSDRTPSLAECLSCPAGHYCPGDDQFYSCGQIRWKAAIIPEMGQPTKEVRPLGNPNPQQEWMDRVSRPYATTEQDCIECGTGKWGNTNYEFCVAAWKMGDEQNGKCSAFHMVNCVTQCNLPIITAFSETVRKVEHYCESLKCHTYCANAQGEDCGKQWRSSCNAATIEWLDAARGDGDETSFMCNVRCDSAGTIVVNSVLLFGVLSYFLL